MGTVHSKEARMQVLACLAPSSQTVGSLLRKLASLQKQLSITAVGYGDSLYFRDFFLYVIRDFYVWNYFIRDKFAVLILGQP
jgi:hypothetical protein